MKCSLWDSSTYRLLVIYNRLCWRLPISHPPPPHMGKLVGQTAKLTDTQNIFRWIFVSFNSREVIEWLADLPLVLPLLRLSSSPPFMCQSKLSTGKLHNKHTFLGFANNSNMCIFSHLNRLLPKLLGLLVLCIWWWSNAISELLSNGQWKIGAGGKEGFTSPYDQILLMCSSCGMRLQNAQPPPSKSFSKYLHWNRPLKNNCVFTAGKLTAQIALCMPIVEEWRSFLKTQFNHFPDVHSIILKFPCVTLHLHCMLQIV